MRFLIIVITILLLPMAHGMSQALKPQGFFADDSIKVGEPVTYVLTFRYPRDLEVVFPGEKDAYSPFEYTDQQFFPTRTDSLYSFDSVAYEMVTFELDSVQKLALPVYVIGTDETGKPDSTIIFANPDSVFLERLITQMPDSIDLKANTEYRLVDFEFNYPYLLAAIGGVILIVILVLVFFGKKIRRKWQIYRLRKENKKFYEQFKHAKEAYKKTPDRRRSEEVLVVWKKYMEVLDRAPYTKMTTKEIVRLPSGQILQDDLRAIDKSIYGRTTNGELIAYFDHLYEHTDKRFKQRIEEIKHAK